MRYGGGACPWLDLDPLGVGVGEVGRGSLGLNDGGKLGDACGSDVVCRGMSGDLKSESIDGGGSEGSSIAGGGGGGLSSTSDSSRRSSTRPNASMALCGSRISASCVRSVSLVAISKLGGGVIERCVGSVCPSNCSDGRNPNFKPSPTIVGDRGG